METFITKHNGCPVKAYLDTETWNVIKVMYVNPNWECDCDLDQFTEYHDWEIREVKKEVEQETKEYQDHINSMQHQGGYI